MASRAVKCNLESAQEHIPTCEKHSLKIDIICEDCDEFICSQCAKTDHKDHDWKTIPTAGSQRRRELKKTLDEFKKKDVKEMDEMIEQIVEQIENNHKSCDSQVIKLQKHFEATVSKLDRIKKNYENTLREKLERINDECRESKLNLEKKKKQIIDVVEFLEEKHSTMSDFSLIDNLKDLKNLLSNRDCGIRILRYPLRYQEKSIKEELLDSFIGEIDDLDDISVIERDSFHFRNKLIDVLTEKSIGELFVSLQAGAIEVTLKNQVLKTNFTSNVHDACLTDNGEIFFTDTKSKSISRLSLNTHLNMSVPFHSTVPLIPYGICQATVNNPRELLVSLMDSESEKYGLNTQSRRLIRHVTLTGDVIREYEYQEDGQTRLFTYPCKVKQNRNTDICVVNMTSNSTSELMILSSSGCLKVVYRGQGLVKKCVFSDVVCDSRSNIILSDLKHCQIHLLCPDGGFVKYLLTQDEVRHPSSMSLFNSTLWVGNNEGLVKVFASSNMKLPRGCAFLKLNRIMLASLLHH